MKGGTYYIIFSVKEVCNLAEYSSNSNKARDGEVTPEKQEKKITPVVTGGAVIQKKTRLSKFKDSIIAESLDNVASYIWSDVFIPALKSFISDAGTKGLNRMLYGKSADNKVTNTSKISYGSFFTPGSVKIADPARPIVNSSVYDYDNIYFTDRGDAEAVLESMCEMLDIFQQVSVGDMYDLANVPTTNYLVNNYGWTSLSGAKVMSSNNGYFIKLPKATQIK